jgi:restriction endonuclease S subunit
MQKRLSEIATISTGQTFRSRVENDKDGAVWVVQMKDLNTSYTSIDGQPHLVTEDSVSTKQLLNKGDILFLAKGNHNKALVYHSDHPAVAVSLFFVIRIESSEVLPDYLAWYINSQQGQNYLLSTRSGSIINSVKKSVMEQMEIEIPSLEKQQLIAQLYRLSCREKDLMQQLIEQKETLINSSLLDALK